MCECDIDEETELETTGATRVWDGGNEGGERSQSGAI